MSSPHTTRRLPCQQQLKWTNCRGWKCYWSPAVATAEDPSAITTIQSAATFSSEQPIKYLFKTEGAGGQVGELYPPIGQVKYRVIQVADGQLEAQSDGTTAVSVVAGFPATTQPVTQTSAVFSQAKDLEGDGTETHYTYPATISDAGTGTMVTRAGTIY
ncbi:uncharacterized protein LOC113636890 isoform X4 [Tachysurus fulvidraco]|uniref:uncharacterized protein LOC113636890 isoform X4 n=1 Tax=Tachysurus fulvidraco TaxID=1234273 RepID=UPI001FEF98D1|nr:uncharacterized protein LOC113636890 isoform X4 [Tachysurus fulvidraco]